MPLCQQPLRALAGTSVGGGGSFEFHRPPPPAGTTSGRVTVVTASDFFDTVIALDGDVLLLLYSADDAVHAGVPAAWDEFAGLMAVKDG